jgi:beta-mannosidase
LKKLLSIFIFLLACKIHSQNIEKLLNSGWEFRQADKEQWYPAQIPGTVHTDLFSNKLIPDPFYGDNETKLQWIEKERWEYRSELVCDKTILQKEHLDLIFEGLDTYAKAYVNDKLVIEADNMFRSWKYDVKKLLKEGKNSIKVIFDPASEKGKELALKLNYTLPGEEKVFTRKAQYQYGWDFAPRFVTCGIWKTVKLLGWDAVRINSVYYKQESLDEREAGLQFFVEYEGEKNSSCEIQLLQGEKTVEVKKDTLKAGKNIFQIAHNISKPRLWWCNGSGNPELYLFSLRIKTKNHEECSAPLTIGLRKMNFKKSGDSTGTAFYFELNEQPIFAKGANYVPQDIFLSRLKKEDYKEIVLMAKNAGMNMLRVWGGGAYADDEFYSECDSNGIMVWQDFMFACTMYPGDSLFVDNIRNEIAEQIKRLRNHPCLALWCGNNEISEGWYNWGWQKQYKYSKSDSAALFKSYNKLFRKIIPDLLKEHVPGKVNYWPSSPAFGWGRKESLIHGDSHYWGVWWGNEPFEIYEKKVGRFMSEYGFQSYPSVSTIKSFYGDGAISFSSPAFKNHQKHPKGFETIEAYMERDFKIPKAPDEYVYVSQLLQSYGMQTAIEAHRRAKPWCMGTLFWQLNDCWPAVSWSAIDYTKTPKAFYYHLQELYNNILLSVKNENDSLKIFLVSDSLRSMKGELKVTVKYTGGKTLTSKTANITVEPNSSQAYMYFTGAELKSIDSKNTYFKIEWISGNKKLRKLYFSAKPKELNLIRADIKSTYDREKGTLKLSSNTLAKNVFVSIDNGGVVLSDNFFDLEAGEEKEIKIISLIKDLKSLKFYTLNNLSYK